MKNPFHIGAIKMYSRIIQPEDMAAFESGTVHELYSTFALARDAEWSTRLFVLEMKEEDEEGIGTFIHTNHHAPAFIGSKVDFKATLEEVSHHEIICSFQAEVNNRIIASGKTGQKILKKKKLEEIFNKLSQHTS